MRNDLIKVYRAVHTWVGVLSALFLFIGFYCGAITMFKGPLRHWAAAESGLPPPVALADAPALAERVLAAHPEARRSYFVHLETSSTTPARLTWEIRPPKADHDTEPRVFGASIDAAGELVVRELHPPPVAQFIDTLHRQVGLPMAEEWSMPVTGAVSLLYFLALVSGVIVLLPTLVKSLFLIRTEGRSVRRKWLDVHNTLGFFSLPFHLVIAFTALVFAFHDEFYAALGQLQAPPAASAPGTPSPAAGRPAAGPVLTPAEIRDRLLTQAPDFRLQRIEYLRSPAGGAAARVFGDDVRQMLRGGTFGLGMVDPHTGQLVVTDYFPGKQPAAFALITSFFSLHFGNFGGTPIRWAYVALGLSGALIFYTGNLLWIEARRRRMVEGAGAAAVVQPRSVRLLAALTVGVCLGTMAGVSLTLAAARWLPIESDLGLWHRLVYYAVFGGALLWALGRGAARAGYELLWWCAGCTLAIPLSSGLGAVLRIGLPPTGPVAVDLAALGGAVVFAGLARLARRRAHTGPPDSVWTVRLPVSG